MHKNVPELLKKVLSEVKGNVENMLSKSRGDYAYAIIDVQAVTLKTLPLLQLLKVNPCSCYLKA